MKVNVWGEILQPWLTRTSQTWRDSLKIAHLENYPKISFRECVSRQNNSFGQREDSYSFIISLCFVCDDYFVPVLEALCEKLKIPDDVAGATFMAAGTSSPELFTSIIGTFITTSDLGIGTIVGSAVFNIFGVIAVCGLFAGCKIKLEWSQISFNQQQSLCISNTLNKYLNLT